MSVHSTSFLLLLDRLFTFSAERSMLVDLLIPIIERAAFSVKKDTAAEMAKKREQERQRLKKLAETNRVSRYRHRSRSRSYSRSPPRLVLLFVHDASRFQALPEFLLISIVVAVL